MVSLASEVESGEIWRGSGPDNFVSCVSDECIPLCNDLVEALETMNGDIITASNIIAEADDIAS
ncbi:MAG: hypothetical protein Phog2KO_47940 [Phototrophicaceae bacterium]